jgi:acyl-CoA synthetase (AMP-forming)/AMP-acid ligase II
MALRPSPNVEPWVSRRRFANRGTARSAAIRIGPSWFSGQRRGPHVPHLGQFGEFVDQVAAGLSGRGVGAGSAVHLVLKNRPAFIALWLAVTRIEGWTVPVDLGSTARDVHRLVTRCPPVVMVCSAERRDVVDEGAAGRVPHIIAISETARDLKPGSALIDINSAAMDFVAPNPADRIAVMFTSGTARAVMRWWGTRRVSR